MKNNFRIKQRCKTISGRHTFQLITKVGYYYGEDGLAHAQPQIVKAKGGKSAYRCQFCDLVDDLYEGSFD